jgi:hypothetical protein
MMLSKREGFCANKNGFVRSFSTSWFGKNDAGGYSYEFCRVADESRLDMVFVHINKGDRWVQIHLNVFILYPEINSIEQLKGVDGLQFYLPPNRRSLMRIESPRGLILAGFPQHKVGFFFSREGLRGRLRKLGTLIENDLNNIDAFVRQWMREHRPVTTNWNGCAVKQNNNVEQ